MGKTVSISRVTVIILSILLIGFLVSRTHDSTGVLPETQVQQYNMACLDFGNETPCALIR